LSEQPSDKSSTPGDDALDAWDGGRMPEPSDWREPDDALARQSGAVSEDEQPVTTHDNAERTAHGSLEGTAGPERTDKPDTMKAE
jgi:hypothetical protein